MTPTDAFSWFLIALLVFVVVMLWRIFKNWDRRAVSGLGQEGAEGAMGAAPRPLRAALAGLHAPQRHGVGASLERSSATLSGAELAAIT